MSTHTAQTITYDEAREGFATLIPACFVTIDGIFDAEADACESLDYDYDGPGFGYDDDGLRAWQD